MNSRRFIVLAITVCMLAACTGCVYMIMVNCSYQPGVASAPTLPCSVALSLSKEFTSYELFKPKVALCSDGYRVPLGPALQTYATYVAQSVFGDVQVLDSGQPPRSDAKLLLIPRVTLSEFRPIGPGSGGAASGSLSVQWDLNDPKTGQTMFSMHAQCEFVHPTGLIERKSFEKVLSAVSAGLMTNLTSVTIQRFNASKEIQRLSGH